MSTRAGGPFPPIWLPCPTIGGSNLTSSNLFQSWSNTALHPFFGKEQKGNFFEAAFFCQLPWYFFQANYNFRLKKTCERRYQKIVTKTARGELSRGPLLRYKLLNSFSMSTHILSFKATLMSHGYSGKYPWVQKIHLVTKWAKNLPPSPDFSNLFYWAHRSYLMHTHFLQGNLHSAWPSRQIALVIWFSESSASYSNFSAVDPNPEWAHSKLQAIFKHTLIRVHLPFLLKPADDWKQVKNREPDVPRAPSFVLPQNEYNLAGSQARKCPWVRLNCILIDFLLFRLNFKFSSYGSQSWDHQAPIAIIP